MKQNPGMELREVGPCCWENLPRRRGKQSGKMRIYASEMLLDKAREEGCLDQVSKVSLLPGLVGPSMAMPDIHYGYGFCIGGIAAFGEDGVVVPGGVGYDINCGVRLVRTALQRTDLDDTDLQALGLALLGRIPCGLRHPSSHPLDQSAMQEILQHGTRSVIHRITHDEESLPHIERGGFLPVTDPYHVSELARQRGQNQLATLGSGNHFLEIQYVSDILDAGKANRLGIRPGQITLLLHSGSRGLGHQVATDYIALFHRHGHKTSQDLPDPQLVHAPSRSPLGEKYLDAHNGAANFAWANRHLLMFDMIQVMLETLHLSKAALDARLVSDHSHNLATWENHLTGGRLLIHRKGATRALPPGHPELGSPFRETGQPVILPGSMGTSSYLMCGSPDSAHAWSSCPHGAGRQLSRRAAIALNARISAVKQIQAHHIHLFSHSQEGLAEEIPQAYKPVEEVMNVTRTAGLACPVARLIPLVVVKG